jgi:hypothetical protein
VKAKGNDTKGRGQANAIVSFALKEDGDGSRVDVVTDLNMTGAVAQYGRASGLMKEIAGAILNQFADNLRKEIEQSAAATPAKAAAQSDTPAASDAGTSPAAAQTSAVPQSSTGLQAAGGPPSATPAAAPVSAFSILWIALKSWLAGLFGMKKRD